MNSIHLRSVHRAISRYLNNFKETDSGSPEVIAFQSTYGKVLFTLENGHLLITFSGTATALYETISVAMLGVEIDTDEDPKTGRPAEIVFVRQTPESDASGTIKARFKPVFLPKNAPNLL